MFIETNRLIMKPFSLDLINAALTHDIELYKEIDIITNNEWPEPDLLDAMDYFRSMIISNGITGFGVIPSERRKGFCEESVKALLYWALQSKKVNKVIAHCDLDNIASFNVLKKCGFNQINEKNGLLEWEYEKCT